MKTRRILYATLSFLAVNIGICPYVAAASTVQLTETSQELSGKDSESGVAFRASLLAGDHVIVDLYIGTKRIHADIDYGPQALRIRSVSQGTETPVALSRQDILAIQKMRDSRFPLPPKTHSHRLRDALGSLLNLISDAPPGAAIDFIGKISSDSFTSICPQIGKPGVATYKLGKTPFNRKTYHKEVTVGPVCYKDPARGRCGKGGGRDPFNGLAQPFTQECLNHDVCCDATGNAPPICGLDCFPEFVRAIPGYIDAPDCGNTGGNWADSNDLTYALSDADSSGDPKPFGGFLSASDPFCPSTWSVAGTRTGTQISFTATNPSGPSRFCAASYSVTGDNDNCNTAAGTWSNSAGGSGMWSWTREGTTLSPKVLLSSANAGPRPTGK